MAAHSESSPFRPQQKWRKCLIVRRFQDNVVNGPTYDVQNSEALAQLDRQTSSQPSRLQRKNRNEQLPLRNRAWAN